MQNLLYLCLIFLANLLLCLALKSYTTCSVVSSLICSGVYPLNEYFCKPFYFFCTVAIKNNIMVNNIYEKNQQQINFINFYNDKMNYLQNLVSNFNIKIYKLSKLMNGRIKQKLKTGSPTLFFLIQVLNLVFGATAIALIGLSIWLWRQFDKFTIVEIVFILLGVFELLLVILVFSAKRSVAKLRCFLFFMIILFLAQLVSVIVIGATGTDIVKNLLPDDQSKEQVDQLKDKLNVVVVFAGVCLIVIAFQMLFVKCYIGSLRQRNNEFDYKYIDSEGQKLTIDQRNQQIKEQVSQKYNKKRQELATKYGNLKSNKS